MVQEPGVVEHPKFRMWLRPDGIVQLVFTKGATITISDATAATGAMSNLTGGRQSPLLVDAHDIHSLDRPSRTEFVSRDDLVSAVALIVGTPLSRLLGNFFLGVTKPKALTRLFDDEASAVEWLQTFHP